MLDFSSSVIDFENYTRLVEQLFLNKDVLIQLAFDFYDTNNDEKISEMDLYKIFQFYGQKKNEKFRPAVDLFVDVIHSDVVNMSRIIKWLGSKR